jgi:hypothetical protein
MKDKQVVNELDIVETVGMWILLGSIVLALCTGMTGCSSSAGWHVEFGITPVTAIHNEATLTDHTQEAAK